MSDITIIWDEPHAYRVGNARFALREGEAGYYVMKDRHLIDYYLNLVPLKPRRILEIGTYTGGSSIFLYELFGPEKLVCVDARPDIPQAAAYLAERGLQENIKLYPNIAQADDQALTSLVTREIGNQLFDLIIDDASHLYEWSLRCFEILIPFLRSGGRYVLEDWGWAHWPGEYQKLGHQWSLQPALSNLVYDFTMLAASRPDIIDSIVISTAPASTIAVLRKGEAILDKDFTIAKTVLTRGRQRHLL